MKVYYLRRNKFFNFFYPSKKNVPQHSPIQTRSRNLSPQAKWEGMMNLVYHYLNTYITVCSFLIWHDLFLENKDNSSNFCNLNIISEPSLG